MGRQGPLTALALGRSPYDDVVQGYGDGGEGESSSTQQYDEKGRPINPETKRLNREIVRSHNEVMHVIGVAEPDPNSNESEVQSARRYLLYEHLIADRMETLANGLSDIAYWTFAGIRHRIMVYKSFSSEPFWNLARVCWREVPRPFSSLFLAGFPTELAWQSFEFLQIKYVRERYRPSVLRKIHEAAGNYLKTHVALYIFLQRSGLISRFALPTIAYFIPFTSLSPFPAPPPPPDFSPASLGRWCWAAALNAAPMMLFSLWRTHFARITSDLATKIYFKLPHIDAIVDPRSHRDMLPGQGSSQLRSGAAAAEGTDTPASHVAGPGAEEAGATQPARTEGPEEDSSAPPSGVSRRPSAFSGRGDDYGSDEEDNGAISGTLISFDVEATESTDAPPGIWSAELRPTTGNDGRSPNGSQADYLKNALTQQPLTHAATLLGGAATTLLLAPLEAIAMRMVARSYAMRLGLPMGDIWEPFLRGTTSWRWVANYLAVDFLQLMLQSDIWAGVTYLGRSYHLTPEQWTSMTPEQHVELVRDREWEE